MNETIVIFRKDRTGWKDCFALFPELDSRQLRQLLRILSAHRPAFCRSKSRDTILVLTKWAIFPNLCVWQGWPDWWLLVYLTTLRSAAIVGSRRSLTMATTLRIGN